MEKNIYYCQSCGGVMEFDVKSQALKCPNCDTIVKIADHREDIVEHKLDKKAIRKIRVEDKKTVTKICTGCGASIEVEKNSTALSCPYCGSSYVMAEKQIATIVPDGVVTFKITEKRAKELFHDWIKHRFFAPNALKNLYQRGNFQGMYIPYWTFDAKASAEYYAMGGKNRTEHYKDKEGNDQTRIVTDWYPTSGFVKKNFDDLLICASERNDTYLLQGIDTYNTKDMPSYSPDYLSGYSSEVYSVDLETGHKKAAKQMDSVLQSMAASDVRKHYDTVKDVHINATYQKETYKHVLVPVYTASYSFKGKNYTVLINGENGAIKGDYPTSAVKVIAVIAGIIAIFYILISLFGGGGESARGNTIPETNSDYIEYYTDNSVDLDLYDTAFIEDITQMI